MSDLRVRRSFSERLFGLLLFLFPAGFRSRFGDDMRELFRDQHAQARREAGVRGALALWARTVPSLLRAATLERAEARHERRRARMGLARLLGTDRALATLRGDLRFAARMLRKSPAFTAIAVLVIALGSGAVTTIFSAVNALVLRPLPGTTRGDRLVGLQRQKPGEANRVSTSYTLYVALRDRARTLDGVAAWSRAEMSIADRRGAVHASGNLVSANFFQVLGVRPALGRFFLPEEDRTPLTHPVLVVSHAFWRTKLGADSGIVGRTVTVSGRPYTIVGVAPAEFGGIFTPLRVDAYVPLNMQPHLQPRIGMTHRPWLWTFGRLAEGTTPEGARAELETLVAAHARAGGEEAWLREFTGMEASPLTGLPSDARQALLAFAAVLLGTATLVLVIASVNVASMLSARAIGRTREMALRTALGAPRGRLVRQLLTETLVLFVLGGVAGVLLAAGATEALERLRIPGGEVDVTLELSPDFRAFAFALGVSTFVGILVGLLPALRGTRGGMASRLRDGSAGAGRRSGRLGNALVVGQLACSLLLLVAAGLFARALQRGASVDPGFEQAGVVTAFVNAESWGYDESRARAFYGTLRERVEAIPGVAAVSFAGHLPLVFARSSDELRIGDDKPFHAQRTHVDAAYFEVMRIPIVRGREFAPADLEPGAPPVAIVNETLARRRWPDGGALGRTFLRDGTEHTVVGVARDAKYESLAEGPTEFAYFPLAGDWHTRINLLVRSDADVGSVAAGIRAAMRALDPAVPAPAITTLREENALVLLPQRVAAMVTGVLGGVGLLLAVVGLYAVIAYSVARRAREMGIRVALGARRADVIRLVLREGMRLAGTGTIVGVAMAAAATRLMRSYLFDVSPLDAPTFVTTSLLLAGVALVANWLPARRAAAADPAVALRAE